MSTTCKISCTAETFRRATRKASDVPGDTTRVTTREIGGLPKGTVLRALSHGHDGVSVSVIRLPA